MSNKFIESEVLELKTSTSELKEAIASIVAMLNKHQKGEVYFGIKNNGEVVGQDVSDKTLRDVSHAVSDSIENSGNCVAFSPEFSNGQSSRTKFLNASRIKSRILDVLKTSNTINRIVHMTKMLRKKKWATLKEGRCQKIINQEGKEEFSQKGIEVIIYTYFDRKRYSKFSTSNHLLKAASRRVKLRSEDFEDYKAKGENKMGNEDDMKRMEREISEKINRNAGVSMHRIYVKSEISNLSSYNIINFPLKFSSFISLSNLEKAVINDSGLPCGILNQTTENIFSLGNFEESVKCQSLVINALCSNFENSANLPLDKPFGFEIISIPCCFRNISNRFFTFSSLRNLTERDTELDIVTTSQKIRCILKGCDNMFFSNARKILKYFINVHSSLKHFKNLPNHNSRTFKSRSTSANLAICNDIFVNFNSHEKGRDSAVFKFFVLNKEEKIEINLYEELGKGYNKGDYLLEDNNLNNFSVENIFISILMNVSSIDINEEDLYKKLSIEMRKEKMKREHRKKENTEWN